MDKLKFDMLNELDDEEFTEEEPNFEECPDFEAGAFSSDAIMECDKIGDFSFCGKCKWNAR